MGMTLPQKHKLGESPATAVINLLKANPPCVLAGSGISLWEPSGLPTGGNFAWDTYDVLFEAAFPRSRKEEDWLQQLFKGLPFEHLMEACPADDKLNAILNRLYSSREINAVHQALADGLADGRIFSLITTNYDCGLDAALEKFTAPDWMKVVTEKEAGEIVASKKRCYFKIHGSAEPAYEDTLMFTLHHERLLPPSKRGLLKQLIADRPLLLLGYSGLDFELCPEIGRIAGIRIAWNNFNDAFPSPNARKLLEDHDGVLLIGNMLQLVSEWLIPITARRASGKPDLVKATLKAAFTESEIAAWRVRVLNSLGAASFALRAIDFSVGVLDHSVAEAERAQAYFHQGKYLSAAKKLAGLAWRKLRLGEFSNAVDVALDASDSFRAYGAFIRAEFCVLFAWLFDRDGTLKAKRLLKQSLILENVIQPRVIQRLFPIYHICHYLLQRSLKACAAESLRTGNWIDLQQVSLVAERIGTDLTAFQENEYYAPPAAAQGYEHLGYYIPQMMCFLDMYRQEATSGLSDNLKKEWLRHYRICRMLEINSGVWKLLATRRQAAKRLSLPIKERHTTLTRHFALCEYSWMKHFLNRRQYDF